MLLGANVAKLVPKTGKSAKRGQGRPTRNSKSAVGRTELIEATRRLLADRPPSKIGRLDVARKADVDPALIRYYFGNLGNLMTEVTAMLTREMHGRIAVAEKGARNADDRVHKRIEAILQMLAETPYLSELIVQQIVHGKKDSARVARREMVTDSVVTLRALVEDAITTKRFRAVDPRFLHIALIGICDFYFTGKPVLKELFGNKVPTVKQYGDFVHQLIILGLRPRSD
jgi:TetR/AcrR family transcriptional regulator